MINFKVAAKAAEVAEDEDVVAVPIQNQTYQARRPTAAQTALFHTARSDMEGAFELIAVMMGPKALLHIKRLVREGLVDETDLLYGNDDNEKGLIPAILEEFGGRPTQPSTDSSPSPATGGRKSTGRSPGKGSTRSASPSTDS